jgi:hypothetical protein
LNLVLLLVFFVCAAFLFNAGLWANALTLINVVTAAMIATNFFEPLAEFLTEKMPAYTYLWDFLSLWITFALSFALLRAATDWLSKVKVRFKRPVDTAGGMFFACWVGWMMVCFTTFSLHTAPLARNFLQGQFQETPDTKMFFGMAPDVQWLAFMRRMSIGPFLRGPDHQFDQQFEFIFKYAERRADFEKEPGTSVSGS